MSPVPHPPTRYRRFGLLRFRASGQPSAWTEKEIQQNHKERLYIYIYRYTRTVGLIYIRRSIGGSSLQGSIQHALCWCIQTMQYNTYKDIHRICSGIARGLYWDLPSTFHGQFFLTLFTQGLRDHKFKYTLNSIFN